MISLLERQNIILEDGLTLDEVHNIEKLYHIRFPKKLREFLMETLPTSKGFYNWRNYKKDNIQCINQVMQKPLLDIYEMAREVYWCDDWGEEPGDIMEIEQEVRRRLKKAPKLIPIYGHRYIPMISEENPPIISVHGIDIIYYGEDLEDYFNIEFGKKKQEEIEFLKIKAIPFWSDIT